VQDIFAQCFFCIVVVERKIYLISFEKLGGLRLEVDDGICEFF